MSWTSRRGSRDNSRYAQDFNVADGGGGEGGGMMQVRRAETRFAGKGKLSVRSRPVKTC